MCWRPCFDEPEAEIFLVLSTWATCAALADLIKSLLGENLSSKAALDRLKMGGEPFWYFSIKLLSSGVKMTLGFVSRSVSSSSFGSSSANGSN